MSPGKRSLRNRLRPRIRILRGEEVALGPGKADLLEAVALAGTISGAAQSLGMSYMRAWTLIRTMNRCFKRPLVEKRRGGASHGAAALTDAGEAVLELYRRMERDSAQAASRSWAALRVKLKG